MRSTDPKAKHVPENFRRVLTIHDGGRLTPALVDVLRTISDHAEDLALELRTEELEAISNPTSYQRRNAASNARQRTRPVLVARADGLAVYAARRLL